MSKRKHKKGKSKGKRKDDMEREREQEEWNRANAWLAALSLSDIINKELFEPVMTQRLQQQFQGANPFAHLKLTNFLDLKFAKHLQMECQTLQYFHRASDLYEFDQTDDLNDCKLPLICKLRECLTSSTMIQWFETITGQQIHFNELSLSSTNSFASSSFSAYSSSTTSDASKPSPNITTNMSMSANVYSDTHYLLCHDDQLPKRKIAYILYLTSPQWADSNGGHLDLHSSVENPQDKSSYLPSSVVTSLLPEFNSFTFFNVTDRSFHSVREVNTTTYQMQDASRNNPSKSSSSTDSKDLDEKGDEDPMPLVRLTLTGWFHGAETKVPTEKSWVPTPLTFSPLLEHDKFSPSKITLDYFIAPEYRVAKTIVAVRKQFARQSSIELANFVAPKMFKTLQQECQKNSSWTRHSRAVYNKRWCEEWNEGSNSSSQMTLFRSFLSSKLFTEFIYELTGIEAISCYSDVRRFLPGSFTIANDLEAEKYKCALDVCYCILSPISTDSSILFEEENSPETKKLKKSTKSQSIIQLEPEMGGTVHYIVENEEEELLSTDARANTLAIVYRTGSEEDDDEVDGSEDSKEESIDESDNDDDDEEANGVLKFVKYVNHLATHSRCDFDMIYRVKVNEESQAANSDDKEEDDD